MNKPQKKPVLRLFFALWPSDAERASLAAWQPSLHRLCGGRVMRPETLHATLVFLGQVAAHRLPSVCQAARDTDFQPFLLELAVAQYWKHNHIAYAAPQAVPEELATLVDALQRALRRHRFQFEERPYKPHVTLLRNAQLNDGGLPPMPAVHWQIGDFALVQSLQDEHGSRYQVLARFGSGRAEA
jgi:RNA 2',3'-cyclic 3'-phosphodiesterase